MKLLVSLLALCAVAVTVSGQSSATGGNALVGAWRVTEVADANAPLITNPQPGLYMFTRQHYSFARIQGTRALPEYPSNDKATDADKVAVFNALYLNSGTYTVAGNTLVASIGPTCSEALVDNGLPVHFEASPPKMGPLVRGAIEACNSRRMRPSGPSAGSRVP